MHQTTTTTLTTAKRRHSRTPNSSERKFSIPDAASLQHRRGSSGSLFLPGKRPGHQDENSPESTMMDLDGDYRPRSGKRTPFGPHANASQDSLNSSQRSIISIKLRTADQRSSRASLYDHNQQRRTSLPALHLQSPVGADFGRPGPSSPPLPPLPPEAVEDIYGGLKSFKFGNASPANDSLSDGDHSEDQDMMSPLPRRYSRKMSRIPVMDDHPLHISSSADEANSDTDEEEKLRQERSKMRAIDDGGRRPSLPINNVGLTTTPLGGASGMVSRATLDSMTEQLDRQLERRRPSQAIAIPRRASRVSQDEAYLEMQLARRSADPQSEPGTRAPWPVLTSSDAAAEFDMNFILNGSMGSLSCPPSPTSMDVAGDTFLNHITRFDMEYGKRRTEWMLSRQFIPLDNSGRPDPREVWSCDFVGKYSIIRGIAETPGEEAKPGRLRANQILIRHFADTIRDRNERPHRPAGPSMWIHKHARKKVISVFREYNPFKKDEVMTPAVSILFTPRDLRSFHTRSRPRIQYHDDATRSRSTRSVHQSNEDTPPLPGSAALSPPLSPMFHQEHVYPPSYRGSATSPLTSPRLHPVAPPSIVGSVGEDEQHPRRGHAEAFGAIDRTHLQATTSNLGSIADAASTTGSTITRTDRGTSITERLFKRKKHTTEKVATFHPPWLTLPPQTRPQTEEEMERMLFGQWDFPRPSDVSGPPPMSARPSESSVSPLVKPEASSSKTTNMPPAYDETEEEKQRRRVRNLSQSFESVGLIASRRPKASSSSSQHRPSQKNTTPTFLDKLPPDSVCFLLPLWPSESATRKHERPRPAYRVPLAERRYLVVYFVQQTQLATIPSPVTKKRPRQGTEQPTASSSKTSFTPFHVVARLITSEDLLHAGMRSLDKGLFVSGTISDSLIAVPDPSSADALSPIIIALCNEKQSVELVPEGLDKLGLRVDPDDGMSVVGENGGKERALTPIGRAVVEIIWASCIAVSSGPATPAPAAPASK
ncbi:hypothetical protein AURDEDRAFT_111355 [Auricularia subglabra TFB-10046 SS5]|nr:hypothetical protein AURDEDRAFT_111355 [Auricularia subglabra TFB-10046 SS5]